MFQIEIDVKFNDRISIHIYEIKSNRTTLKHDKISTAKISENK